MGGPWEQYQTEGPWKAYQDVKTSPIDPSMSQADVIRNAAMGRIPRGDAEAFLRSVGSNPALIDQFGKGQNKADEAVGSLQSTLKGALSGFGDEAAAAMQAPVTAAISKFTDNPLTMQQAYQGGLDYARNNQDAYAINHPTADMVGDVGGMIAQAGALRGVGGPLTARALKLFTPKGIVSRVATSAVGGAAAGGAQGAVRGYGEGETPDQRTQLAGDTAAEYAKGGAALGAVAPIAGAAVKAVTQPMKKDFAPTLLGEGATGVDDVGKFSHIQKKLADNYGELKGAEKKAWDNVRAQAAGKSIGAGSMGNLQKQVMDAQATLTDNDAAGVVDRILTRWGNMNRIPAEELIANRATLSKASMRNAGLRPIVETIDNTLSSMGINGLSDALKISKQRFSQFDDVAPIANSLGEYATAADFGKAVFGAGSIANASKAAQRVKEVMRAAGEAHKDVKHALDQAVVHRVLQTATSAGDETVWLDKAFREINGLRQKNPELWGMLSKDTQEGLSKLGDAMNAAGKSGKLEKASQYTLWGLNKIMSPLGVRQVVQRPATTASQVRLSFDDVKKLMKMRPDEGRSFLDTLTGKGK